MAQKCPGESQPSLSDLCPVPLTPSPGCPGTDLDFLLVVVDLPGDVNVHSTPLARFLEKKKKKERHESVTFKNLWCFILFLEENRPWALPGLVWGIPTSSQLKAKGSLSIPLEKQKWKDLSLAREFIWLSTNATVGHTPLILWCHWLRMQLVLLKAVKLCPSQQLPCTAGLFTAAHSGHFHKC